MHIAWKSYLQQHPTYNYMCMCISCMNCGISQFKPNMSGLFDSTRNSPKKDFLIDKFMVTSYMSWSWWPLWKTHCRNAEQKYITSIYILHNHQYATVRISKIIRTSGRYAKCLQNISLRKHLTIKKYHGEFEVHNIFRLLDIFAENSSMASLPIAQEYI